MTPQELHAQVMDAPRFKTRQQIWHRCIEAIQPGHISLEFGVFTGGSINYFANARPDNEFHGFDSFDGLPTDWIAGHPRGHFKVDLSKLRFAPNVFLHKGLFSDTIALIDDATRQRTKFLHIDCDLGSSSDDVLTGLALEILGQRCLLLFDEFYNYRGYEAHEFASFLKFHNQTKCDFEVVGRNINHQQVLIQVR